MILAVTLSTLLNAARVADSGQWEALEKFGIQMNGYDWTRDFAISDAKTNLHLVVIARMWGSYLFVFDRTGKQIAGTTTRGEILSVELFDFDSDKRDEIITRQITNRGTGIYLEEFVIYSPSNLRQLWRATSYWYSGADSDRKADYESEEGFIRPSYEHLLLVSTKEKGGKRTRSRKFFKFDGKNFVAAREEP